MAPVGKENKITTIEKKSAISKSKVDSNGNRSTLMKSAADVRTSTVTTAENRAANNKRKLDTNDDEPVNTSAKKQLVQPDKIESIAEGLFDLLYIKNI